MLMNKKLVLIMEFFLCLDRGVSILAGPHWLDVNQMNIIIDWLETEEKEGIFYQNPQGGWSSKKPVDGVLTNTWCFII